MFSLGCLWLYHNDLYHFSHQQINTMFVIFWLGVFSFTFMIRTGYNERFEDPSLTVPQMLWVTIFLLINFYMLNEGRSLIMMCYFAILSFGFFKLRFREFLSVGLFVILGYILVLLYLFIKEPERIDIHLELIQLLIFSFTVFVMLYTGSAIHHLRERSKKQYADLQQAHEINKLLATTDELTGLYNRRYFMDKLAEQKALSERNGTDFVVFYCDLDHFKHINDTFGHHTGDIVLQKFAEILKASIREIDYASRFGGEEFVCLLVDTDIDNARKVTERIRKSLADFNFNDIAPSLHATVSIGICNFKQYNTIQETLMSADNRMYRAKRLGRNRVIFSDELQEGEPKEGGLKAVD
jgi:diguanylate cyclase (GGDEF)-like protein